jgi:DNA-binding MarR family transcriptional regulator
MRSDGDAALDLVGGIMDLVKSNLSMHLKHDGITLQLMETHVLRIVLARGGCTQLEVIRETRRDKAQIGKLIRSLAGHRLLTQSPDPADARRQRLTLTAEGRAVARKSEAHRRAVARQLLRGMSRSERSVLIEMLAGIQRRLEHATKSTA